MADLDFSRFLVYVHIPKTGGNTMRAVLESVVGAAAWRDYFVESRFGPTRQGGPDGLDADRLQLARIAREITGTPGLRGVGINAPYGLHNYLGRPVCYVTVLREPIGRLESYWRYAYRTRDRKPRWTQYARYDFDMSAMLTDQVDRGLCNQQTRMIAGVEDYELSSAHLELAKHRIRHDFAAVVDVEGLDRTLPRLFADRWRPHWRVPRFNVGDEQARPPLSRADVAVLAEANELDLQLYEWFREAHLPYVDEHVPAAG